MPNISKLSNSKFLKTEMVTDGDLILFKDAGNVVNKIFKQDGEDVAKDLLEITVEFRGETKIYSPNTTSMRLLVAAWGHDTETWIGKSGRLFIVPTAKKDMLLCKPAGSL